MQWIRGNCTLEILFRTYVLLLNLRHTIYSLCRVQDYSNIVLCNLMRCVSHYWPNDQMVIKYVNHCFLCNWKLELTILVLLSICFETHKNSNEIKRCNYHKRHINSTTTWYLSFSLDLLFLIWSWQNLGCYNMFGYHHYN